jgi:hypothetical protein
MNFKSFATAVFAGVLLGAACMPTVQAATRSEIKRIVIEEAENSRVPVALALAVARVESSFNEDALSSVGARGVMQIMPKTGSTVFGVNKDELWDPRLNIQLGIHYLEQLFDQYGGRWDLALSHYNGGSLKGGKGASARPHSYTRKYVNDVLRWKKRYLEQAQVWKRSNNAKTQNADDGWTPAKTRVKGRNLAGPTALKEIASRSIKSAPDQPFYRSNDRVSLWDLDTDFDDADFFVRLFKARRSLDDFASVVRWYPGNRI